MLFYLLDSSCSIENYTCSMCISSRLSGRDSGRYTDTEAEDLTAHFFAKAFVRIVSPSRQKTVLLNYFLSPWSASFLQEFVCKRKMSRHEASSVLQVFLPSTYPSWSALPSNPLEGLPGAPSRSSRAAGSGCLTLQREDYSFYCDPCQKGFHTQQRYDEHLKDHIYCTVEGCGFTCRASKKWKMEMHMETLHNRPDAPQLMDVDAYITQRKNRFPTTETVQTKVEELFYRAARGEVLPDERRRWMRRHGVVIKKRPNEDKSYISSNAELLEETALVAKPEAVTIERSQPQRIDDTVIRVNPARKPKLIPEGPDGRLSRSQKVQLIREKYRETTNVPKFYVCNRCGEKGAHWVAECPTTGDDRFDRRAEWGEERKYPLHPSVAVPLRLVEDTEAPQPDVVTTSAAPDRAEETEEEGRCVDVTVTRRSESDSEDQSEDDDAEEELPQEVDARNACCAEDSGQPSDSEKCSRTFVSTIQPAAAARLSGKKRPVIRSRLPRGRAAPSLFDRLTEDSGVDEKGLLLQAVRFFVARNFFENSGE